MINQNGEINMNLPKFFKCGCAIRDEEISYSLIVRVIFRPCNKHRKEFVKCSWQTWAKTFAPSQYKKFKMDK